MPSVKDKPELLLHICCAGCGVYTGQMLAEDFDVTLYYYNPNIFPEDEYGLRRSEAENIAGRFGLRIISAPYDHRAWLNKVAGHEQDRERGERCRICYSDRLRATAAEARRRGIASFATTLTTSPHKDAALINRLGAEFAEEFGVGFLVLADEKRSAPAA